MNSLIKQIKNNPKQIKKSLVENQEKPKINYIEKPEPINNYIEKPEIKKINKKVVEIEKCIVIVSYDPNDTTLYL